MSDNFKVLSDIAHIQTRFSMYGGSQVPQEETVFLNQDFAKVNVVGGLLKVINEIIDNSIDEAIRTNFAYANRIVVSVDEQGFITITDNGRGIPSVEIDTPTGKKYQMVAAFTMAKSGSNFDDTTRVGLGMNGVGSAITFATSKEFHARSSDGKLEVILDSHDADITKIRTRESDKKGTTIKFLPNYKFFGLETIDRQHISIIEERLKSLALAYPEITFRFNGKSIKTNFQDYFGECDVFKTETATYGVTKSDGSFQTHSIVNGLSVKGGSHIDYFTSQVINEMCASIKRSKKVEIQANKLKAHLRVHCVVNGFPALKFDSQTKERVTNSQAETRKAIGEFDAKKFASKLMKNKDLVEEILAYTKLQADLDAKKDLKKLEKKKTIKSDNYIPAVGDTKNLFICEGLSAMGGISSSLGRKGNAYYAIRGVPLNVMGVSHQKFSSNKELSELYAIITSFDQDVKIVIAADSDADGSKICSLLSLFIWKYLPDVFEQSLHMFKTPVAIGKRGKDVEEWVYNLSDISKLNPKLGLQYLKGLGSWDATDLQQVIVKEGINKMLPKVSIDDEGLFASWFSSDTSDYRKEQILKTNGFDIMRI